MKRSKIIFTALLLAVTMPLTLTGCFSESDKAASDEKKDLTKLTFYMMNGPVNDLNRIIEKANKIIGEKINAQLEIIMTDTSAYASKINLMINSNDPFDLCFSANWGGINYFQNAAKGAFADLTDLIPKYAPQSYKRIPSGLWDGVKVNGRIYGMVNYQMWGAAKSNGYAFRADLCDEVGFDWKAVKEMLPLEALKYIGDNLIEPSLRKHPDMIGWETTANLSFFDESLIWDMENVGDVSIPGVIRLTEPKKVINQFETPEFMEFCQIMHDWYRKGYVRKDGATLTDTSTDRKAGRIIATVTYGWPDTIDAQAAGCFAQSQSNMSMVEDGSAPSYTVSTSRTIMPATAGSDALITINASSKNVQKSLELIELLNTDDELYMLLTQGEEGVDYLYDSNGKNVLVDGKYNFNWNEWQLGQSYSERFTRSRFDKNADGELQKKKFSMMYEKDRTAPLSPLSGFNFDPEPVKTQCATVSSVVRDMLPALSNGAVDPKTEVPNFIARLKSAGVDDIIAEKQKQLNTFYKIKR